MARIYIGRSTGIGSFERHVVLKMILPERQSDYTAVQMFLDEARLAASLNHQNVAQVFEVDEDAGIHFLAMEYVHGQDLRALLAKAGSTGTRVPLELALTVVTGAAAGLHHAHERRNSDGTPMGIVHRDVSPSNIMIGYDGAVKLLDFGIAKATSRSVETQSGIIKGKFAYMAPEQCRGRDVDRRSDVFSLGIILYEVTTQHRCFRADSDFDTMHRIVTADVVRPTRLVQGYPQALEAIVMKALALDASERYQSAGELLEAIESFAVAARMSLSTMALGRFMREMFGEMPEPWLVSGRVNQPLHAREQTISNTNASSSGQAGRLSSPPIGHEDAPLHLPPDTVFEGTSRDGLAPHLDDAGPYAPMMPPFAATAMAQGAVRTAAGSQQIPPQPFGMHPGSGSGPAHGALLAGQAAMTPQVHANARTSRSDMSYPRYEAPYDADVNVRTGNRLLYVGLGVVLVGIIVLLAIVIADDRPQEAPARSSGVPAPTGAPGEAHSVSETPDGSAARTLTPEPVRPEAFPPAARSAGAATPDQIHIHVASTPAGAEVLLGGTLLGITPIDITRPRATGIATLTIRHARYQDATAKIDLGGDYSNDVTLAAVVDDSPARPPVRDPRPAVPRPRSDRGARPAASERPAGSDRTERGDRPDRGDRSEPTDHGDRLDRGDHAARPDRGEHAAPRDGKASQGDCQPPERFNPFDTSCRGKPCPPCPADAPKTDRP
jgi:serine/threonine protein kinase